MSAEQQYDDCSLQIRDEQYMRKALIEAEAALGEGEIPIGAVVVCREKVIARAHNLTETLCDVTAHAEMRASPPRTISSVESILTNVRFMSL